MKIAAVAIVQAAAAAPIRRGRHRQDKLDYHSIHGIKRPMQSIDPATTVFGFHSEAMDQLAEGRSNDGEAGHEDQPCRVGSPRHQALPNVQLILARGVRRG